MEEVESILIYTLKQIGCDVGLNIGELSPTQIIKCVSRCLELVEPDLEIPSYDSSVSMSGRYKVASEIAQVITDLGYTGEIGCQSFLYPTETDTRKHLIFIIERLPEDVDSDLGNTIQTLLSRIAQNNEIANPKNELPFYSILNDEILQPMVVILSVPLYRSSHFFWLVSTVW